MFPAIRLLRMRRSPWREGARRDLPFTKNSRFDREMARGLGSLKEEASHAH